MDRRLQSLGLTQAQWRAIVHLSRSEGMTQAALAESLEIQPITLTRLIDRMESAGWVERRTHPLDRRAVQLYLTPQSQPILEEMHARAADTLNEATRGVTPRAQRQLVATLEQIKHNLIAAEARRSRRHHQESLVMAEQDCQARPRPRLTARRAPARCAAGPRVRAACCARRCCSRGRSSR